jgi:hypothetical protein
LTDDSVLRLKIRTAIETGGLPNRLPDRVWGGPSTAGQCAVCGGPTHGGVEFELVFSDTYGAVETSHSVHPTCLKAFEREVQSLDPGQGAALANRPAQNGSSSDAVERMDGC